MADKPAKKAASSEHDPADAVGPEPTKEDLEKQQKADEKAKKSEDKKNLKGKASEDYDPWTDPDVPSSFIASQIQVELEGGESPTLAAVKEGKKSDEEDSDDDES